MNEGGVCELCGREVGFLTRHHLIPKARHGKPRVKRNFERHEPKERIAMICRPCHDHVHALFQEKALEQELNTLEALAAHPDVARFVAWIQKKPAGFGPATRDADSKGGKRKH